MDEDQQQRTDLEREREGGRGGGRVGGGERECVCLQKYSLFMEILALEKITRYS